MESSTIIKLRQAESTDVDTNGSYTIALKESVILEKGDIAKVHTAIIDTTAESIVELPTKTRVTMGIGKYIRNYRVADTATTPASYNYTAIPATAPMPDLETPVSFVATINASESDDYIITEIGVFPRNQDILRDFGGIDLLFNHIEIGSETIRPCKVPIPSMPIAKHMGKPVMFPVNQLIRTKLFQNINTAHDLRTSRLQLPFAIKTVNGTEPYKPTEGDEESFIVFGNNGNPIETGRSIINPFIEDLTFDLNAGTYTPQELTTIISDKMANLQSGGIVGDQVNVPGKLSYPVNSPCLRTLYDINDRIALINGAPQFILMPEAVKDKPSGGAYYLEPVIEANVANRTTDKNLLIGANEVSLNYDENLQKLNFDILHFPIYGGPASELVPIIAYSSGNNTGGDAQVALPVLPQISNAGIFFTSLTSQEILEDSDRKEYLGNQTSFWSQLGFQDVVVTSSHDFKNPIDPTGTNVIPCAITFDVGTHITGVFLSLDSIVDKSQGGVQLVPTIAGAESTLTTPIISNREFNNVINNEGYYLLEIGMNLPQKMIGGATSQNTTSNRLQSIIGKYFSQNGNFLQDDGAGSIVYQHQSDIPQVISELSVRVLHADQSPPEPHELGVHNSVFLEIIKSNNQ